MEAKKLPFTLSIKIGLGAQIPSNMNPLMLRVIGMDYSLREPQGSGFIGL